MEDINKQIKKDIKTWISEDATTEEKNNARKRIIEILKTGTWSNKRDIVMEIAKTPGTSSLTFFILAEPEIDMETKVECLEELCKTHGEYKYLAAYLIKLTENADLLNSERLGWAAYNLFLREKRYLGGVEKNLFSALIWEWNAKMTRRIPESYVVMLSHLLSLRSDVQKAENFEFGLKAAWQNCFEKYNVPEDLKNKIEIILQRRTMTIK